jgi:hypothetical protein
MDNLYYAQYLAKNSNEWFWLGCKKSNTGNAITNFNHTEDFSNGGVQVFLYTSLYFNLEYLRDVEAIRNYYPDTDEVFEYRRNPYKLKLGIEEFMLWKKYKGKKLYGKI